ncbi:MAG: DUF58 domain-containing protein [Actinomycetota bacterium]
MTATRRTRYALTPAGAGVIVLFVPGAAAALATSQVLPVLIAFTAGFLLAIDAAMARWSLRVAAVEGVGPDHGVVGEVIPLTITVDGRRCDHVVGVEGAVDPWVALTPRATGEVMIRADERGVIERRHVWLQTAFPLGLVACFVSRTIELTTPIHVAPRPLPVTVPPLSVVDPSAAAYRGDDTIGLRPYVVGDSPRDVHWPSVARTGTMLVRDRRRTAAGTELDVVVETFWPGCDLDVIVGQTHSALEQLLAQGYHIRLVTVEADDDPDRSMNTRYEVGLLSRPEDIGVRLARVAVGRPGLLSGVIGSSARLVVKPEGLEWQPSR